MNKPSSAAYQKARHDLALDLETAGAVLTSASNHQLVIERQVFKGFKGMERGFKLKLHEKNPNAPLSPFYLNLRTADNKGGPLTEELVDRSATCMHMLVINNGLEFDAVAGVPRAGDPFAEALARLTGKPRIILDKYEHGGKRSVASLKGGIPTSVGKVLIVDDLITRADSKIETVRVFQDEGIIVDDVVVLVDREQGGYDQLMEWGCHLHSVYIFSEMLDLFVMADRIQSKLRDDIKTYLAAAA